MFRQFIDNTCYICSSVKRYTGGLTTRMSIQVDCLPAGLLIVNEFSSAHCRYFVCHVECEAVI